MTGAILSTIVALALPGLPPVLLVPLVALFLGRTRAGLGLQMCGENPRLADAAGLPGVYQNQTGDAVKVDPIDIHHVE